MFLDYEHLTDSIGRGLRKYWLPFFFSFFTGNSLRWTWNIEILTQNWHICSGLRRWSRQTSELSCWRQILDVSFILSTTVKIPPCLILHHCVVRFKPQEWNIIASWAVLTNISAIDFYSLFTFLPLLVTFHTCFNKETMVVILFHTESTHHSLPAMF